MLWCASMYVYLNDLLAPSKQNVVQHSPQRLKTDGNNTDYIIYASFHSGSHVDVIYSF